MVGDVEIAFHGGDTGDVGRGGGGDFGGEEDAEDGDAPFAGAGEVERVLRIVRREIDPDHILLCFRFQGRGVGLRDFLEVVLCAVDGGGDAFR